MATKTDAKTVTLTREAAESLTEEIRTHGKALATHRAKFASAVKRAKEGDAHAVLGFSSWTDYVATVFADMPGLAKSDREYLTAFMAGEGMSSRAVARVLGVSQATASRMIRAAEQNGEVASDREVTGTDGRKRKADKSGKAGGTRGGKAKGGDKSATVSIAQADTETLRATALAILAELSDRWAEGDEAAERATREIADAATIV